MKRFWLVLLSLVLIAFFCTSALAVDVKVSGSFYAAGLYQDKTTVMKNVANEGPSTAFYYQQLRVKTEFIIAPGLKLVTRFDALERSWGATRSTPGTAVLAESAGTRAENENIAFDLAYVSYKSPIGTFEVGYREKGLWGTDFANNAVYQGMIYWSNWFAPIGAFAWAQVAKVTDSSFSSINNTAYSDLDNDEYLGGVNFYGIKNVEFGFMYDYCRYAGGRNGSPYGPYYGYLSIGHLFEFYGKAKAGPVKLEAEVDYVFGDWSKMDNSAAAPNTSLSQFAAYAKAVADIGPAYVGGIFAYIQGDDPGTTDKKEGGFINGGRDWNPCLIMFNYDRTYWAGNLNGYNSSSLNNQMANAWFFQLLAGVKPISKLDVMATVSYANADKKPTAKWQYNDYGTEVDLTATYKITQNLSYMLGGGYLFTGKYFKGESDSNELRDNFMVVSKLTVTF